MAEYWWAFAFLAIPIILFILHFMARSKAKVTALKWLAAAENLIFHTVDSKILFVAQKAYQALPPHIKMFIPYGLFSVIVTELYNEVKILIVETQRKMEK